MSDGVGRLQDEEKAVDLADLYRRHAAWLLRRLRRRLGDQAEDVVQDVYLRLATTRSAIRHPRALLMTAAVQVASNRRRGEARGRLLEAELRRDGEAEEAVQAERLLLKQIILGLPEPLRDVFVLSRFEGLSSTQIGERLRIAPKTAEWRLTKALAHCAAQLRR